MLLYLLVALILLLLYVKNTEIKNPPSKIIVAIEFIKTNRFIDQLNSLLATSMNRIKKEWKVIYSFFKLALKGNIKREDLKRKNKQFC